jgi:serine/threonine-protein kinase
VAREHFGLAALWQPSEAEYLRRLAWAELALAGPDASHRVGVGLKEKGDRDGALALFGQASTFSPASAQVWDALCVTLARQGRLEDLCDLWQKRLQTNPPQHDAWYGYAELCLFLGREKEYRRACTALLARFGASTDPVIAERTGRACLLLPASGEDLQQAAALADRAEAAGPTHGFYGYFELAKGLAEYRRDLPQQALALLQDSARRVSQLTPRLVLAMTQYRCGQRDTARQTLAAACAAFDWDEAGAINVDAWTYHALRREAETLIVPNLAAFLQGDHQPRDNVERLGLLDPCYFHKRYLAAARLYAEAFAADPKLAEDFSTGHRYNAACCAALAASARGNDSATLGDGGRVRLRQQAYRWLRADLEHRSKLLQGSRAELHRHMQHWQKDPDLATVRDRAALAALPEAERRLWEQLWADVAALLARAETAK